MFKLLVILFVIKLYARKDIFKLQYYLFAGVLKEDLWSFYVTCRDL